MLIEIYTFNRAEQTHDFPSAIQCHLDTEQL